MLSDGTGAVAEVAAGAFAVIFIGAALGKIEGFGGWAELVARFPLRPTLQVIALFGVPLVELCIAMLIILRPALGLAACAALLTGFALVLARYLTQLRGADCRCFGNLSRARIDARLILRNLLLAVVAGAVAVIAWVTAASTVRPLVFASVLVTGLLFLVVSEYRLLPRIAGIGELGQPPRTDG